MSGLYNPSSTSLTTLRGAYETEFLATSSGTVFTSTTALNIGTVDGRRVQAIIHVYRGEPLLLALSESISTTNAAFKIEPGGTYVTELGYTGAISLMNESTTETSEYTITELKYKGV